MPRIPVIIAAYQETASIGRTLSSLDPETLQPILVVNGEPLDGPTATVARQYAEQYNVTILEREQPGKFPAIQAGLRFLGDTALEPVLFIDADTHLVFPKRWGEAMLKPLVKTEDPSAVSGMIALTDGAKFDNTLRMGKRAVHSIGHRIGVNDKTLYGFNMGIKIGNKNLLADVLDMPNIWPGEDRALADKVSGQVGGYYQSLDPSTYVQTSARFHKPLIPNLVKRMFVKEDPNHDQHVVRAPEGVEFAYEAGEYIPYIGHRQLDTKIPR